MKTWKITTSIMALALASLAWGCGMAETKVFQPAPLDGLREVTASEASNTLDAEVLAFLRDRFSIESARYYQVPGAIPWIAVSKSVQNQMAEKAIKAITFEWYEPGIDFVEVYPQGNKAFALAMPQDADFDGDKLVGFYILGAREAPR